MKVRGQFVQVRTLKVVKEQYITESLSNTSVLKIINLKRHTTFRIILRSILNDFSIDMLVDIVNLVFVELKSLFTTIKNISY